MFRHAAHFAAKPPSRGCNKTANATAEWFGCHYNLRMARITVTTVLVAAATTTMWYPVKADPESDGAPQPRTVPADVDRSPIAVAVSPDGRSAVTANHTALSVALIDLQRMRAVTEHACGRGPWDVVWIDEETILVSLLHDDAIAVLAVKDDKLSTAAVIPVGDEPRGIAIAPPPPNPAGTSEPANADRPHRRAYVALSGVDQVAVVDLNSRRVTHRIAVGGHPRTLAVAPNGRWLATCCSTPGELFVHDTATNALLSRRSIFDGGFNLGVPAISADSAECFVPSAIDRTFPVSADNIERGWVIDNRISRLPLPDGEYWKQKQIGLDVRGNAVGDAHAAALSPDGKWLAVTCGGSHELLIFDAARIVWPVADAGDFLPPELQQEDGRFRRLELGGRPLGITFLNQTRAVIANYLANALQIVDVADAKLTATIPLGGSPEPSLARRGEAIFYDADRSLNSWFSCHTCHPDGHTSAKTFDTLNDGNYDTYKLAPSLRGVTHTAPWTWHGWQNSLPAATRKSLSDTMSTEKPITDDDVRALVAFLAILDHPPSPHRAPTGGLTADADRGRTLFEGKAGCFTCHRGAHFTSAATFKVGLESRRYFYSEFNPPSLRGLHARRRFLHDGRADTLREVLTRHHQPDRLAGEPLHAEELANLIAYLMSL
jgi:YVTN family beta-propeller protein